MTEKKEQRAENTPIFTALKNHELLSRSSFHTPGHKCNGIIPDELLRLDYTELPDTDALYEASGVILRSEELLAELFGAGCSLISAGGCTLAIQAMLRLAAQRGGRILCARNAHRSAVNAMALLGIDPVWIMPEGQNGYTGRITPEDAERAFAENDDITAMYVTSPSYYGELCDISALAEICHKNGALLLVDNAHGSHLAFLSRDLHPLFLGADMTACSLHKTLPVLTGGAVLNLRDASLRSDGKAAMSLFGSTSPSYPVMCSIELCADHLRNGGIDEYRRCEEQVMKLKELAAQNGIGQPQGECDPLRLTLDTAGVGLCGKEQQEYFEKHGIDCEFCDGENAVMIFTPFNTERDYERVRSAICGMEKRSPVRREYTARTLPEKVMTLQEAVLSRSVLVPVRKANGRTAADTVCPCPPGVPVIMPGEKINDEIIRRLELSKTEYIRVTEE